MATNQEQPNGFLLNEKYPITLQGIPAHVCTIQVISTQSWSIQVRSAQDRTARDSSVHIWSAQVK